MTAAEGAALPTSKVVAVIGAGTMGSGIAQIAALHGHRVQLHDMRFGAADAARKDLAKTFDALVAKGRLAPDQASAALERITTVVTLPDACVAGLVIEAIVEDIEAKRELFRSLENVIADDCILASNTSSLSITALGAGLKHPERVVGMHFFNPAPLMPLVEVVRGLATADQVAANVYATAEAWGKTPVHARSTPGFIVNRCARPFYGEALRLLSEGVASPATIDAVLREASGFRMGPFELMDLIGHDVNFAVTKSVWEACFHDPRYTPSLVQQELVAAGYLGRKSGQGFYRYGGGAETVAADTVATETPPTRAHAVDCDEALAPLLERLQGGGVEIRSERGSGEPHLRCGEGAAQVIVALTDGRSATERALTGGAPNVVLVDRALDLGRCSRLAVARSDLCAVEAFRGAIGLLQASGAAVSVIDDTPAMIVLRIVSMLVNEACDAALQRVAAPAEIDLAMRKGVNYPRGPFEWAAALGPGLVRDALQALGRHYGEDRYRLSPLLVRRAASGRALDVQR